MAQTKISLAEAAVLTVLAERPDISEDNYKELKGHLKTPISKEIATGIREENTSTEVGVPAAGTVAGRRRRRLARSNYIKSLHKLRHLYQEG